jgi:hypothetical protein
MTTRMVCQAEHPPSVAKACLSMGIKQARRHLVDNTVSYTYLSGLAIAASYGALRYNSVHVLLPHHLQPTAASATFGDSTLH